MQNSQWLEEWLTISFKMDLTENQRECMHAVKISPNAICALCTYISRAQFSASTRPVRFAQCSNPKDGRHRARIRKTFLIA